MSRAKKPAVEKRGPGRPRVGEGKTIALTVRLDEHVHRVLCAEAKRRDISIGELARERLSRAD